MQEAIRTIRGAGSAAGAVKKGDAVLTLRDAAGVPIWAGQANR